MRLAPGSLARARRFVAPLDRAVGVDQDQRAVGHAGRLEVGAVGLRDLALGLEVGEQRGVDAELLAEGLVGVDVVDADADQLDALLLEFGLDLLVDRELVRADGAEVERVEDEQHATTAEVGERDLLAVLVAQREVGGRFAGGDDAHGGYRRRPSSATRAR